MVHLTNSACCYLIYSLRSVFKLTGAIHLVPADFPNINLHAFAKPFIRVGEYVSADPIAGQLESKESLALWSTEHTATKLSSWEREFAWAEGCQHNQKIIAQVDMLIPSALTGQPKRRSWTKDKGEKVPFELVLTAMIDVYVTASTASIRKDIFLSVDADGSVSVIEQPSFPEAQK